MCRVASARARDAEASRRNQGARAHNALLTCVCVRAWAGGQECYPYLASRLFTDPDPRAQARA
eukprot:1320233-Rhodomonas_salina.1